MFSEAINSTVIGRVAHQLLFAKSIKRKAIELALWEREEQKRRTEEATKKNQMDELHAWKFEKLFKERFVSTLILIDTTVWMDKNAGNFLQSFSHLLKKYNKQVYLCTAQLNELEKKKRNTKYGDPSNSNARMALNRIEKFQLEGRLKIGSLKIDKINSTYADPELIEAIKFMDKQGKQATLITSDRTLRIRTRQFISNECDFQHNVVDLDELKEMYMGYFEHYEIFAQAF